MASLACLGYVRGTGSVAVILRLCAVADNEQLYVFKQSAACPKTFAVVAVDLVERFLDIHTPAFQFHMHKRQAVHQYRHIVTVFPYTSLRRVLVDYLQRIIVDVFLVYQVNVLHRSIIAHQQLNVVLLYDDSLFHNAVIAVGNLVGKERLPFIVGKFIIV